MAVIAGSGRLPVNVAAGLKAAGHPPFIVIAGGEAGEVAELKTYDHATLELEGMAALNSLLKRERITHVVLAGGIGRRPRLTKLRPSLELLDHAAADRFRRLAKGDNALLKTIVGLIEKAGPKVVGAHEIVPDLLASDGVMTKAKPTAADRKDLAAAFAAAKAIGALDIGQAACRDRRPRHRRGRHRRHRRPAGQRPGAARARPAGRQEARRHRQMRQARTGIACRPAGDRAADRQPRLTRRGSQASASKPAAR